jgi:cytochrome c5
LAPKGARAGLVIQRKSRSCRPEGKSHTRRVSDQVQLRRARERAEEIAEVAIAIAGDGKGLPAGKGDHAAGKKVYERACSGCHGENLQGVAGLPNMPSGAAARLIGGRATLATKNPVLVVIGSVYFDGSSRV